MTKIPKNERRMSTKERQRTEKLKVFKTAVPLVLTLILLGAVYLLVLMPDSPKVVLSRALHNSFALKSMPELKSIYDNYFKSNPKKFIEILKENQEMSINEIIDAFKLRVQNKLVEQTSHLGLTTMTMNQLKLYNSLSLKEVRQ